MRFSYVCVTYTHKHKQLENLRAWAGVSTVHKILKCTMLPFKLNYVHFIYAISVLSTRHPHRSQSTIDRFSVIWNWSFTSQFIRFTIDLDCLFVDASILLCAFFFRVLLFAIAKHSSWKKFNEFCNSYMVQQQNKRDEINVVWTTRMKCRNNEFS